MRNHLLCLLLLLIRLCSLFDEGVVTIRMGIIILEVSKSSTTPTEQHLLNHTSQSTGDGKSDKDDDIINNIQGKSK